MQLNEGQNHLQTTSITNNKILFFEHSHFAKMCSLFLRQLGDFFLSSQIGIEKENPFGKFQIANIT